MTQSNIGLRGKVIGLVVITCVASLLGACAAFVWYDRTSYADSKRDTLSVLVAAIAGSAVGPAAFQDAESARYVLRTLEEERSASSGAIYLADGSRLASWTRSDAHATPERLESASAGAAFVGDALVIVAPITSEGAAVGHVRVVFSTADIDARTQRFLGIALAVLAAASLLAVLVTVRLEGIVTGPVHELARAARRVRVEGDFTVRARKMSNDELGLLTDAFNEMLAGIAARDTELEGHRHNLEALVEQRTRDLDARNAAMRLVLDEVDQGLVTIDRNGVLSSERSRAFERFFGAPAANERLAELVARHSERTGGMVELGWDAVFEDVLPVDVALAQLPRELTTEGRHFAIEWKPIMEGEMPRGALVIFTDVTSEMLRKRTEAEQREFITAMERVLADRAGFDDLVREMDELMRVIETSGDAALIKRALHTVKGNVPGWGLDTLAARCHELEDRIEAAGSLDAEERASVRRIWDRCGHRIAAVLGERTRSVEVPRAALAEVASALESGAPPADAARRLRAFCLEPTSSRLAALAERAGNAAARLGREVDVLVDHRDVRVPRERLAAFWASFVHVLRNAVDHGIEAPEARVAAGKPRRGRITLRTSLAGDDLVVEAHDDGRGVDWERVKERAAQRGLPVATAQDLQRALFADGLSTRDEVSDTSGRGVGMSAFGDAVSALGGSVQVLSQAGQGTVVRIVLPAVGAVTLEERGRRSRPAPAAI